MSEARPAGYLYADATHTDAHRYLLPAVRRLLADLAWPAGRPKRVFDLGCGNGSTAANLTAHGYEVTGVDPSDQGIEQAKIAFPDLRLYPGSAYDDLAAVHGRFPAVVSLEVVEHVFYPRKYAACVTNLLEPGGTALISTPYHAYWKNLAMAVTGKFDRHVNPLWDYGHIKFWSPKTLTSLLTEAGLSVVKFDRVGRIPLLAKSMIAVVRRTG
jgi:2-polyprenyl-6-hydroxyphenyl methylase/3-demethylubiquinone-9 3-methyltransferase